VKMFLTPPGARFSLRHCHIANARTSAVLDVKTALEFTTAELKCLESSHKRLNQVMKILHRPLHSAREGFRCGQDWVSKYRLPLKKLLLFSQIIQAN
jgi:hypothetical protein